MRLRLVSSVLFFAGAGTLLSQPQVVTLPAAASIVGAAPFFSDVRVFNTSYSSSLAVTATYRCFLGACPAAPAPLAFTLAPRDSRAFDDMVAAADGFDAPDSAGGVEFVFEGAPKQLVVTSRLYSTTPTPTVGMFIPGLPASDAYALTVLTSIRNRGDGDGFRTNVGVFNPGGASASVAFRIFDGDVPVGITVMRNVAAHAGVQVNNLFTAASVPDLATSNAVVVVTSTLPVFSYAAVIDNATTDPIFVVGAEDQSGTLSTPTPTTTATTPTPTITFPNVTPTVTPTGPTATPTLTPTGPTPTVTPTGATPTETPPPVGGTQLVAVTSTGGTQFVDSISGNSTSTITAGMTIRWLWESGTHSTTSGPCPPCTGDGLWDSGPLSGFLVTFEHTFNETGTFPYFCSVHGSMMTGTVIVDSP